MATTLDVTTLAPWRVLRLRDKPQAGQADASCKLPRAMRGLRFFSFSEVRNLLPWSSLVRLPRFPKTAISYSS